MRAHQNPFSISRLDSLIYRLPGELSVERLSDRFLQLTQQRSVATLLGNHGSGKSTLLKKIGRELLSRGFQIHFLTAAVHMDGSQHSHPNQESESSPSQTNEQAPSLIGKPEDVRSFAFSSSVNNKNNVFLLDCGESIWIFGWLRFWLATGKARVLMTVHKKGAHPVLHHCQPDANQFVEMCEQLIQAQPDIVQTWFREQLPAAELRELFQKNGGDVRQCFFDLYDACLDSTVLEEG